MRKTRIIQKGFTLIESIMVILLITILSAVATTMFSGQKIFTERFFTDDVTQMLHYARKVAMATECEVEVSYRQPVLMLLQRENCHSGNFARHVAAANLLEGDKPFEIVVPKEIQLSAKLPLYIDSAGRIVDQSNSDLEKIIWKINKRMLNIDPFSGFIYESH